MFKDEGIELEFTCEIPCSNHLRFLIKCLSVCRACLLAVYSALSETTIEFWIDAFECCSVRNDDIVLMLGEEKKTWAHYMSKKARCPAFIILHRFVNS